MLRAFATSLVFLALAVPVASAGFEPVKVKNNEFSPAKIKIAEGDKVRWKNTEGTHTITMDSGGQELDAIISGDADVTSDKFKKEGVFKYICTLHIASDNMKGKVVVGDGDKGD